MNFEQWLTQTRSPNTVAAYTRAIGAFSDWMVGTFTHPLRPVSFTRAAAQEYLRARERGGASPATLEQTYAAMRVYVAWARATEQLAHDPLATPIPLPKKQDPGPRGISANEALKFKEEFELLATAETEKHYRHEDAVRNWAIFSLMAQGGLRVAEVCGLVLTDLHISPRKGHCNVLGKGNRPRTVPLNVDAREAVEKWLAIRPDGSDQHLFIGKRGEPLRPRGVQRALDVVGKRIGIKITPHMLRHTCAKTLLKKADAKITEVAAQLGHKNLNTTFRYVRPSLDDLSEAVERMC